MTKIKDRLDRLIRRMDNISDKEYSLLEMHYDMKAIVLIEQDIFKVIIDRIDSMIGAAELVEGDSDNQSLDEVESVKYQLMVNHTAALFPSKYIWELLAHLHYEEDAYRVYLRANNLKGEGDALVCFILQECRNKFERLKVSELGRYSSWISSSSSGNKVHSIDNSKRLEMVYKAYQLVDVLAALDRLES